MTAVAFAHTVDTVDTVDMGAKNRANAKTKLPGYIERYVIAYRGIELFRGPRPPCPPCPPWFAAERRMLAKTG